MRPRFLARGGAVVLVTMMVGCLIPFAYLLGGAVLLLALWFFLRLFGRDRGRLCRAAFLLAAAVFLLLAGYRLFVRAPAEALAGESLRITAKVESSRKTEYGCSSLLRVTAIRSERGEPITPPPLLHLTGYYNGEPLPLGSRIESEVIPKATVAPGFSYTAAFHAFLTGSLSELSVLSGGNGADALRERIHTAFTEKLTPDAAALMDSMLLGDRGGLPDRLIDVFRKTGLLHLLALSGLHLSLVAALFTAFCRILSIPRKVRIALTPAAAFFFLFMTGAQVSMRRAIAMMMFAAVAALCGRKSDSLESLGFSVIALCLTEPYLVWHPGFLGSVCSTYGVVYLSPQLTRYLCGVFSCRKRWSRKLIEAAAVAGTAWFSSLPVAAAAFDEISLVGAAVSLLLIPLFTLTMTFGFLTGCLCFLPQDLIGVLFGRLCSLTAGAATAILRLIARFPFLSVQMRSPGVRLTVLATVCWVALALHIRFPLRRVFAGAGAAVFLAVGFFTASLRQSGATVTVFSRAGEKFAAVETDAAVFLLIAGSPDRIGLDAAAWMAKQPGSVDVLCLLTPELGLSPGADTARRLLLPGVDSAEVTWTDTGCILNLPEGRLYFGEPSDGTDPEVTRIYLKKIPVYAGQNTVKCDIIKGTYGMETVYGKEAVFRLDG